ncbi:hypothetical protein [Nonomuraea aurantiaca]|uniref:hypothetical protein n=1 Tax=Nonomuraea aurantiaca TaxID=2878562 RepID=UPI0027DEB380|nr:hypothetical protein [Nonomuraea aurantiaca]
MDLALRLDGKAASANTIRRKRAALHAVLEYAVELEELPANPVHKVKWKPPTTTETVDPRVVVNPCQADALLTAVASVGGRGRGRRLQAIFACMWLRRPPSRRDRRVQKAGLPSSGNRLGPHPRRCLAPRGQQHIEEFGIAGDGRLFRSERGKVVASTAYTEVWQDARALARPPRLPLPWLAGRTT